jgi:hypothetical protein
MQAYVFWHWPLPTITAHDYTEHLISFHQSLRDNAFPGFHSSHIFQLMNAPWGPPNQSCYEDWYLVENFAALETLNTIAVTAANKAPHDQAARYAAAGKAGLYQLCAGVADPTRAHIACWFAKPSGMAYTAFFSLIRPLVEENKGALWQRQMTLGPTPEFCWWAPVSPSLPATFTEVTLPLVLVWSTPEL